MVCNYLIFIENDGAPTQTRTADLLITNQLLYQLSYRGLLRMKPGGFRKVAAT